MPEWLSNISGILLVVFFFGFSVFVHEFGHLLAAVWRGLHVEKFSIGFGHRIWGFKHKGIDFIVGWLPFGGYVALPQLEPNDEPQTSDGKILDPPKPLDKIIVAVAGPLFNLIFAFVLGVILWKSGKPVSPPIESVVVDYVPEQSVDYQQGLRDGDKILKINDHKIKSSDHLYKEYILAEDITLEVERDGKIITIPEFKPGKDSDLENLRFPPFSYNENYKKQKPIVNRLLDVDERTGSKYPAKVAGLKKGDVFVKIDGKQIEYISQVSDAVKDKDGAPVNFTILRDGQEMDFTIEPLKVTSHKIGVNFRNFPKVFAARNSMPAYEAGIRKWDKILAVDGKEVKTFEEFEKIIQDNKDKTVNVEVDRNGKKLQFPLKVKYEIYMIGVVWERYTVYMTPYKQFEAVFSETFRTLNALVNRGVQVNHLSGPLGIGKGIFDQWKYMGIIGVLSFIFMINISLAIFNLLPLPVLDGGHIFIAIAELVSRKKVPAKVLQPVTLLFVLFFFSLMIYVTMNDFKRTGELFKEASIEKTESTTIRT